MHEQRERFNVVRRLVEQVSKACCKPAPCSSSGLRSHFATVRTAVTNGAANPSLVQTERLLQALADVSPNVYGRHATPTLGTDASRALAVHCPGSLRVHRAGLLPS